MASPSIPFPLVPGQPDVEFRFTFKTARQLERASRPYGGIGGLVARAESVESLVMITHHALLWNRPKLTDDTVIDWMQAFVEDGGDVKALTETVTRALKESGVYGREESDPNPQTPVTTTEKKPTPAATD